MKKNILFLFLLFAGHQYSISQVTDSSRIDSLEKQVLYLKDSAKVDCLNLLSQKLGVIGGPTWTWSRKGDSVYHYATIAYAEAKKIGYTKGIAAALINLAVSEWSKGIDLRIERKNDAESVKGMENYLSQAIPLANQLQDHELLGYAYESWSDMISVKNKNSIPDEQAEYFKKAIDHFHITGNDHKEGEDCLYQGERYIERGYYEEGLEYLKRSVVLNKKCLNKVQTKEEKEYNNYLYQQSLADIGDLFKTAGDYESALEYLNQARQFGIAENTGWDMSFEKAELFLSLRQPDSTFYYLNKQKVELENNVGMGAYTNMLWGAAYLLLNQPDSALSLLKQSLTSFRTVSWNGRKLCPSLLYIGEAYAVKENYATALPYLREGIYIALKFDRRPDLMKGYGLLSNIHRSLGNNDSAYQYLLKYTLLKDSIQNRQFIFRLNNYKKAAEDAKKEAQIGFLNKDNEIKHQQLKQEATFRNFLIAVFIAIIFAGLYVFRNISMKRKNEKLQREQTEQEWNLKHLESKKKQVELQRQAAELEMQALRAQMNPHFIFNCLSSINRFILKNESKIASIYLIRFSRLMRMVLNNSQKSLISLDDELEMLGLYLEMERLRFKNSFDYGITFLNTVDSDNVFIPPLLLQPFCENAIWHGLMHKEGQGRLDIELSMEDNILNCTITDNGVGRGKAEELKSKTAEKEKSMGLKITTERLALLNREKGLHTFYEIEDLYDETGNASGTKVILKINFKESVEEKA